MQWCGAPGAAGPTAGNEMRTKTLVQVQTLKVAAEAAQPRLIKAIVLHAMPVPGAVPVDEAVAAAAAAADRPLQ